jgi:hypothetical protein
LLASYEVLTFLLIAILNTTGEKRAGRPLTIACLDFKLPALSSLFLLLKIFAFFAL